MTKQGTPTMGGLMFIIGIGITILVLGWRNMLAGDFSHLYVYVFSLVFGAIGFIDDYQKVKHHRNTGLTAPQVGKVMAGIYPNWDAAAYADWCRRFDLPENKKYGDYSTGMKMKQCLAVALSHHPKLLLLDEATSGLDPVVRDELIDLLLDFVRDENHAILISSHIVSDLEKLCDTIAFLHKGKLLLCEDKDTLREEYALWHGTAGQLEELDKNAIVSRRVTAYGAEALVKRELVPAGSTLTPVSIEELFVLMVKGENVR